jgi:alpha-galactosidase
MKANEELTMIEIIAEKYFHLRNEEISYLFYIMENQQLGHLYYGSSLGKLTEEDIDYLTERTNKSAGTVKYSQDSSLFTLADRAQEYPVYGTSDFKKGTIEVFKGETPLYLDFKVTDYKLTDEKERQLSAPKTYAAKGESETLTITLKDVDHQLELELNYTVFKDSAAIAKSQRLRNLGETPVNIQKMLSGILELPTADYEFLHLSGAWLKERHIKRQSLQQGSVSVSSLKGASGHQHNPFIALQQKNCSIDTGEVYAMNVVYSGNFAGQVEVDEWDKTRMMLGINPEYFSKTLKKEEQFDTPETILMYSNAGLNQLSSEYATFIENHIIDPQWRLKNRPIVFNNWEATYFNFNHQTLLELAELGKQLGMECFVLDDGWFGKRNVDRGSLGDWWTDKEKFPDGIGAFAKDIHALGLQFGLWFEPEMVSPDSHICAEHPEWVVRHPVERVSIGRGQYVLDFSNPEVVSYIYGQMKKIIKETNLDYIKWDMNRNITEAYSPYLEKQEIAQTEFFHRYIWGVYSLYEKILTDFPDVLIEGCAGGGGRYDLGILFYSPQIWPSDDSDAVERLAIQTGTLLAYPLSSFSNHVSASPNHQVERVTSLKMRQDLAMFGPLGYELDLHALSELEKEQIKTQIDYYKQHRDLLTHGHFFQLLETGENEVCWGVVSEDKKEAIIGFYRILAKANNPSLEYIKIPVLDKKKLYQINGEENVRGQVLEHMGLRKPYQFNGANHEQAQVRGDFQSYIYCIQAIDEAEGE